MVVYTVNKKPIDKYEHFQKAAWYSIYIQKSVAFLEPVPNRIFLKILLLYHSKSISGT